MKQLNYSILIIFLFGLFSCSEYTEPKMNNANLSVFEKGKANADEMISHIDNHELFMKHFEKNAIFTDHLPKLRQIHLELLEKCKLKAKDLVYFDYFKEILRDSSYFDKVHYIYEGPSACGDTRYILSYILYKQDKRVELIKFSSQSAAAVNDMIMLIQERRAKEQKSKK